MKMPAMDGAMLARAIKSDPKLAATRLIMMTALDRQDDAESLREFGLNAYLTKPVKQTPLFDCLVNVMAAGPEAPAIQTGLSTLTTVEKTDARPKQDLRILIVEDNIVIKTWRCISCKSSAMWQTRRRTAGRIGSDAPHFLRCRLHGLPDAGT
jgi:PleD family two-component response regulator